jgi:DNA polymerase (family 10)
MDNTTIAAHFRLLGELMELYGENPFKIKSYFNAGRSLKKIEPTLAQLSLKELQEIPGIGKAIAEKIEVLSQTGTLPLLQSYLEKTPSGVVDMMQIKGIGPSKVAQLWQELQIESLGELHYACTENRLTLLKGFGEKTQEKIKNQIEFILQNSNKQLYARVEKIWEGQILPALQKILGKKIKFYPTGNYRSQEIILDQLDVLITGESLENIAQKLQTTDWSVQNIENKIRLKIPNFIDVFIETTEEISLEYRRFETTGSPEHIAFVESKWNQKPSIHSTEVEIYQAANLPVFPPECRHEHTTLFSNPEEQFKNLVEFDDIKGVVHNHTKYSDGNNTVEELAQHCKNLGYEYLVVSDHSKSAFYANGLSVERIFQQQDEIDFVQQKMPDFKIFKSIECDILYDGQLDYEAETLKTFDLVIASVHSQLNMNEEKAMSRVIRAIENPYTNILGHMTGRLLLSRAGYPLDHKKIIDACKANGVIIELNANPHRLDIDWTWIPYCMEKEVLISINPDAHTLKGVDDIRYGVIAARKAGLQKEQCLNTLNAEDFIETIRKLKA